MIRVFASMSRSRPAMVGTKEGKAIPHTVAARPATKATM